jgi:hypothetical protein
MLSGRRPNLPRAFAPQNTIVPTNGLPAANNAHPVQLRRCWVSGNGAGFIAIGLHGPSTTSLGVLSFNLHTKLGKEHNSTERWGLPTLGINTGVSSVQTRQIRICCKSRMQNVAGCIDYIGDETRASSFISDDEYTGRCSERAWC